MALVAALVAGSLTGAVPALAAATVTCSDVSPVPNYDGVGPYYALDGDSGTCTVSASPPQNGWHIYPYFYSFQGFETVEVNGSFYIGGSAASGSGFKLNCQGTCNFSPSYEDVFGNTQTISFTSTFSTKAVTGITSNIIVPVIQPLSTTQAVASKTVTVGAAITPFTPVTATGGYPPLSLAVAPALPTGLTIDPANGEISGTPTSASAQTTYTVTATDSTSGTAQTSSKTFDLTVNTGTQTITFPAVANTNYGLLPPDNFTRTIEMLATSSAGLSVTEYSTNDDSICRYLPYNTNNPSVGVGGIRQNIQITGVGTCTVTAAQSGNASYSAATPVQRTFTIDKGAQEIQTAGGYDARNFVASDTFAVGSVAVTGGAANYFVGGSSSGLPVSYTSKTPGVCSVSGTTLRSYFANPATVWFSDATVTVLTPGTCTLELAQAGSDNYHAAQSIEKSITINPPALTTSVAVASGSFDAGSAITPFTPVTAAGGYGALTYAVSPALPTGLNLDTSTGEISGTAASTAQNASYAVTVTDSTPGTAQTSAKSFNLAVTGDVAAPVISNVPDDISVGTDAGKNTAVVTWVVPTASDNIGVTSFTSTHQPGATFPIGTTKVTYTAMDAFNNTTNESFNVTVTDDEAPQFVSFPDDISIEIDYPGTGSTATWTEPAATDNAPGVTVKQTGGLVSGSTFPLGETTVTYRATDAEGLFTDSSFKVTITVIPPGSATFNVASEAGGTFTFTSLEQVFNFTVDASSGKGTSGAVMIRPGSYKVAFSQPSGVGIESASCTSGGAFDASAQSFEVTIASKGAVTCSISALDSLDDTTGLIGNFLEAQSQLILNNGPDSGRRIGRLNGTGNADSNISAFGMTLSGGATPFSLAIDENQTRFSYSLRRARSAADANAGAKLMVSPAAALTSLTGRFDPASAPSPSLAIPLSAYASDGDDGTPEPGIWPAGADAPAGPVAGTFDVWVEGRLARYDSVNQDGTFGIVHAGADYLVTRDLLIGVGVQFDWSESDTGTGEMSAQGVMAGPYLTARLSPDFYVDLRAAWGRGRNEASPYGTYADTFDSERALVTGALIGRFALADLVISPEARLSWYRETTEDYVDSLNVAIPSVTVTTGTFEFGPTISTSLQLDNDWTLSPHVKFQGIWTFEQENTATAHTSQPGLENEGLRARAEAGFSLNGRNGAAFDLSGFADGIGYDPFSAWGGKVALRQRF